MFPSSTPDRMRQQSCRFKICVMILPTIETCFNCFGTRSSDTKERIKMTKKFRQNLKVYTPNFPDTAPPPPAGEWGEVSKMARACLKEKFLHPPCGGRRNFSLNCLNLKQFKTVHYRIHVRTYQVQSGT